MKSRAISVPWVQSRFMRKTPQGSRGPEAKGSRKQEE
jgi:hypothetical protein